MTYLLAENSEVSELEHAELKPNSQKAIIHKCGLIDVIQSVSQSATQTLSQSPVSKSVS